MLLDADSFCYEHAHRHTTHIEWADGVVAHTEDADAAFLSLQKHISELAEQIGCDEIYAALTDYDQPNFRKAIFPGYKKNRGEKPTLLFALREWMATTYKSYIKPGLEADDVCGILSTKPHKGKRIVVSIDKDLATIPGWLFNPGKDEAPRLITEAEADYAFYIQCLTGDAVDTYPGCPGIGPVRAGRILDDALANETAPWDVIVNAYRTRGLTEEDALQQARCARILRHTDYDFKRKEPILWQPPK